MKLLTEIKERIDQAFGRNSLLASNKKISRSLELASAKLEKVAKSVYKGGTALSFVETLQKLQVESESQLEKFFVGKEKSHVFVDNEYLKVLLIRWKPGELSSIHAHPKGGGIFKVLWGNIEELRYSQGNQPSLYSKNTLYKNSVTYIDDRLGMHAVGNPFSNAAISFHAYLKNGR